MSAIETESACAAKVTTLLNEAGGGDVQAAASLLPLVYEQLRALAGRKMQHERADQTLQATALVHEAYLRLVDQTKVQLWDSRWHFFAAAAESMRRILVENARRRGRIKRGGGRDRIDFDSLGLRLGGPRGGFVRLHETFKKIPGVHPEKSRP